jgi:hypothetical protein
VLAWSRQGVPLREIAARLTEAGHPVLKDSVHRHLRSCVDPDESADIRSEDAAMMVALIVRDAINRRFGSLADTIAVRLAEHGLAREAAVVQTATVESMHTALDALPQESTAYLLLEARALVGAMKTTLVRSDPSVCVDLAAELSRLGADDLSSAVLTLAERSPSQDSPAGDGAPRPAASPVGPQPISQKETA